MRDMLRFITCGSVDDGKSTLLGRLLYDSKKIYDDQLNALIRDSKKSGTQKDKIDFALLLDGLQSEREQGITIDVAYRFFSTDKRKFIVADTPGHEQYTRNMVTGASTADLAIILIDARHGIKEQTKRHTCIMYLLGIKHIIVAINKMDQLNFSQKHFNKIKTSYQNFQKKLENNDLNIFNANKIVSTNFIPISALHGDNLLTASKKTPWYRGNSLMHMLNTINIYNHNTLDAFRFPVQLVNRHNSDFRGFCGTIASGSIKVHDEVLILPSKKYSKIKNIILPSISSSNESTTIKASEKMAITLTLEDEIDISRGDMIVSKNNLPLLSSKINVMLIWMDEIPLDLNTQYLIKHTTTLLTASFEKINYKLDINKLQASNTNFLSLNEIGSCNLVLTKPLMFDIYTEIKETGSFIVIDKYSNSTVAAGIILNNIDKKENNDNIFLHQHLLTKQERSKQKNQTPFVLWFTGLSGSGKSTLANALESTLHSMNKHTYILDGDNIRHGLNADLSFSINDRDENIRRVAEVSKLFVDAGTIVITAFISPFKKQRQMVKEMLKKDEFIEVFIDTPINICEMRDTKGLYKQARENKIKDFTGISSPFEAPLSPDIHINNTSVEESIKKIINFLKKEEYL